MTGSGELWGQVPLPEGRTVLRTQAHEVTNSKERVTFVFCVDFVVDRLHDVRRGLVIADPAFDWSTSRVQSRMRGKRRAAGHLYVRTASNLAVRRQGDALLGQRAQHRVPE
jgi:hypothetical protein